MASSDGLNQSQLFLLVHSKAETDYYVSCTLEDFMLSIDIYECYSFAKIWFHTLWKKIEIYQWNFVMK